MSRARVVPTKTLVNCLFLCLGVAFTLCSAVQPAARCEYYSETGSSKTEIVSLVLLSWHFLGCSEDPNIQAPRRSTHFLSSFIPRLGIVEEANCRRPLESFLCFFSFLPLSFFSVTPSLFNCLFFFSFAPNLYFLFCSSLSSHRSFPPWRAVVSSRSRSYQLENVNKGEGLLFITNKDAFGGFD